MKKIMIFAALAALVSLASCQKEGITDNGTEQKASPVFTASIAGPTKTTIDMTDGKVSWEEYDEITVSDALGANAVYEIESIDATTGKATFVIKTGETPLGQGPYTATYGTEPEIEQTYSETAGKLYMTAPETSGNSFSFTVQCGLMEINLTKAGESVKSIAVTGTPTGESETTYTLTCTDAQSIAEKTAFYISVAAGSYNKIVITDSEDKVCTLTAASGLSLENNHIKPITFDANKLNFLPAGALKGEFSVSATKKVYFSKGNLWYGKVGDAQTATLHFEDAQWKSTPASNGSKDADHVSHFTWTDKVDAAVGNSTSGSNLFCDENNKQSVDGSDPIYYALSTEEWKYLFNTRAASKVSGKENARYAKATVNDKAGIILLPDTYEHPTGVTALTSINTKTVAFTANIYDLTVWEKMEDAGAVFLPATGFRNVSNVSSVGVNGYYWSSTASGSGVFSVSFDSSSVKHVADVRSRGYSVRLITESK